MASPNVIVLKSSDGVTYEVDESVAFVSETIKNMFGGGFGHDNVIPLLNVSSKILPKVIDYCKKQVSDSESLKKIGNGNEKDKDTGSSKKGKEVARDGDEKDKDTGSSKKGKEVVQEVQEDAEEKARVEEQKKWETSFMDVDQQVLFDLFNAADYLNIKGLLEMAAEKAASMIKGKTPDQIREIFKIKNDFTPEEYEQISKETAWAFQ